MKKCFLYASIFFLTGMVACNSGSSDNSATTDSTAVQTDTSHSMKMEAASSLPMVPADASVFFKSPKNGESVTSPVKVEMGVKGMSVDSAGAVKQNSGHFHILIDQGDSIPTGVVIPKDSAHLHFGNAQQETSLTLSPGKHNLTLQFADGAHRSYGGKLASTITVDVKK